MPRTPTPDDIIHQAVISDNLTSPPGGESQGDRYIIAGLGGAWSGYTIGDIVEVLDTSPTVWQRVSPQEGDEVYIKSIKKDKIWNGSMWIAGTEAIDGGRADTTHTVQDVDGGGAWS